MNGIGGGRGDVQAEEAKETDALTVSTKCLATLCRKGISMIVVAVGLEGDRRGWDEGVEAEKGRRKIWFEDVDSVIYRGRIEWKGKTACKRRRGRF